MMALKIDYKNMSPAVRKSLELEAKKLEKETNKCPGGENCKHPNSLCTECGLEH